MNRCFSFIGLLALAAAISLQACTRKTSAGPVASGVSGGPGQKDGPPKTILLPPGPKTQIRIADTPPTGLNAIAYRSGIAIQAPDEWTIFTPGGYLSVLSTIDPSIGGASMDMMAESDLVLWHATKAATAFMAPVDLRMDHWTSVNEDLRLEGLVKFHLDHTDDKWRDIGRVNTPIGPAQHLLRYYDRINFRNQKVPYSVDAYLFGAPHDMYRLLFRIPSQMRPGYLPIIERMVSSFRVFKPVQGQQDVVPDYVIQGDRFMTQGQRMDEARAAESRQRPIDELNRINALNEANRQMREQAEARNQPPTTPPNGPPSGQPDNPPAGGDPPSSGNPPGTTNPGQNTPPPTPPPVGN